MTLERSFYNQSEGNKPQKEQTPIRQNLPESATDPPKLSVLEDKIGAYIYKLVQQKDPVVARILDESQIEIFASEKDKPEIKFHIGSPSQFEKSMADLARQITSMPSEDVNQKLVELFQKKFLEEALPLLEWRRKLSELEKAHDRLREDISIKDLTGSQRKVFSKEMKKTITATQHLLENLHSIESRSSLPEAPVQWEVDHLLKKSETIHSRLEQIDDPPHSYKAVKAELQEIKALLNEMTGKPLEAEKRGWLGSLAGWFSDAIKRSQSEQDAIDFAFTNKYHEPIEELHSRLEVLNDHLIKLDLPEKDPLTLEYQLIHEKVQTYYDTIEFRIAYFLKEAALEDAIKELTDQKGHLMSGKLDFSPENLANVADRFNELLQLIDVHHSHSGPRLQAEIEKKLQYQTSFVQDKISHFLEHVHSEMQAEYEEILAHLAHESEPEGPLYLLNSLYEECSLFIEGLEPIIQTGILPKEIQTPLENSLSLLDDLANAMDETLDLLKASRKSSFDPKKVEELRAQRPLLTREKKRRKWQKEQYQKIEAEEQPRTFFQRLFTQNTAKSALFFYLQHLTPYAQAYANHIQTETVEDPKNQSQTVEVPQGQVQTLEVSQSQNPPLHSLSQTVQAEPLQPDSPLSSAASRADKAFWLTWPESVGKLVSSFFSSPSSLTPLELLVEKNLEEALTKGKVINLQLQDRIATSQKTLDLLHDNFQSDSDISKKIESLQDQYNRAFRKASALNAAPTEMSPIPDVLNWAKEIESIKNELEGLDKQISPIISLNKLHRLLGGPSINIDQKMFIHVLGDLFGKNTELEGGDSGNAANFRLQALQAMITAVKENENLEATASMEFCRELFNESRDPRVSLEIFELLEKKLQTAIELYEALKSGNLALFQMAFKEQIDKLSYGDSFFFSGGWAGHAIVYEIRKQIPEGYTFRVFNTGGGINYHARVVVETKDFILPFTEIVDIPKERITDFIFLQSLQELVTKTDLYPPLGPQDLYGSVLPQLQGKINTEIYGRNDIRTPQVSGTCSYTSLVAYLNAYMGDYPVQSEYFELFTQLKALSDYDKLNKDAYSTDEKSRNLMRKGISTFSEKLQSLHQDHVINDLELAYITQKLHQLKINLEESQKTHENQFREKSPVVNIVSDPSSQMNLRIFSDLLHFLEFGEDLKIDQKSTSVIKSELIFSSQTPLTFEPSTILKELNTVKERLHQANLQKDFVNGRLSIEMFVKKIPDIDSKLWDQIEPSQVREIIHTFTEISQEFVWSIISNAMNDEQRKGQLLPAEYLTQLKLLTLADKLSRTYHSELGFELPSLFQPTFVFFLQNKSPHFQFYNPDWEIELNQIKAYWKEHEKKSVSFFGLEKFPAGSFATSKLYKLFPVEVHDYLGPSNVLQRWGYIDWVLGYLEKPEVSEQIQKNHPHLIQYSPMVKALYVLSDKFDLGLFPNLIKEKRIDLLPSTFFDLRDLSFLTDFLVTIPLDSHQKYIQDDLSNGIRFDVENYNRAHGTPTIEACERVFEYTAFIDHDYETDRIYFDSDWQNQYGTKVTAVKRDNHFRQTSGYPIAKREKGEEFESLYSKKSETNAPVQSERIRLSPNLIVSNAFIERDLFSNRLLSQISLSELREFLELSSFEDLQVEDTLGYYNRNAHLFADVKQRMAFKNLMFDAGLLEAEFHQHPMDSAKLSESLSNFCESNYGLALEFLDWEGAIFFLEMNLYFENYTRGVQKAFPANFPPDFVPSFMDSRKEAQKLLESVNLQTSQQSLLHLIIAKSYLLQPIELDDLVGLFKSAIHVSMYGADNDQEHLAAKIDLRDSLIMKRGEILSALQKGDYDHVLNAILNFATARESKEWEISRFPYCYSKDGTTMIDLESALVFEGGKVGNLPQSVAESPFLRQFLTFKKPVLAIQTGIGVFEFIYDQKDHYRLIHNEMVLYRKINNHFFQFVEGQYLSSIRYNFLNNFHHWFRIKPLLEIYLSDPVTHQLKIKIESVNQGQKVVYKLDEKGEKTHLVLHDVGHQHSPFSFLGRIEPLEEILVWQDEKSGQPQLIELLRHGLQLSVVKQEEKFIIVHPQFPGYQIAEKQVVNDLGDLENYLVLEKKSKKGTVKQIVIFPKAPLMDSETSLHTPSRPNFYSNVSDFKFLSCEVNPATGKVTPKTVEERLYLAMLHGEEQNYERALKYLEGFKSELRPYTKEEIEILTWIIEPQNKHADAHPKAIAFRLQALSLLIKNEEKYTKTQMAVKIDIDHKIELYKHYLQNSEHTGPLALDEKKEILIIKDIYRSLEIPEKSDPECLPKLSKNVRKIPKKIHKRAEQLMSSSASTPYEFMLRWSIERYEMIYLEFKDLGYPLAYSLTALDTLGDLALHIESISERLAQAFLYQIPSNEKSVLRKPDHLVNENFFMHCHIAQKSEEIEIEKLRKMVEDFTGNQLSNFNRKELISILRSFLQMGINKAYERNSAINKLGAYILLTILDNPHEEFTPFEEIHKQMQLSSYIKREILGKYFDYLISDIKQINPFFFTGIISRPTGSFERVSQAIENKPEGLKQEPGTILDSCIALLDNTELNVPVLTDLAQMIAEVPIVETADSDKLAKTGEELQDVFKVKLTDQYVRKELQQLESRIGSYTESPKALRISYEITDYNALHNLRLNLEQATLLSQNELKEQRLLIESLANKPFDDSNKQAVRETRQLAGIEEGPISLDQAVYLFLKRDMKLFYKRNSALSERDILHLSDLIQDYLIKATHTAHLQNIAAKIEAFEDIRFKASEKDRQEYIKEIVTAADQKREYSVIDHPEYLVFEYQIGILLRQEQIQSLDNLEIKNGKIGHPERIGSVIEMKPGSGKTYVLLPILGLLNADGEHLAIEILPEALMPSMSQDLQKSLGNAYGRVIELLIFSNESNLDAKNLQFLLNLLEEAITEQKLLLMTSSSFESLYLKFVQAIRDYAIGAREGVDVTEKIKEVQLFRQIFKKFKDSGVTTIDEVHLILDVLKSFHFTVGEEKLVDSAYQETISSLFLYLVHDESIQGLIKFKFSSSHSETPFTAEFYEKTIRPKIIADILEGKIGALQEFMSSLNVKEKELIRSFLNDEENIEAFQYIAGLKDERIQDILSLLKEECTVLIPITAKKNLGEHFGDSSERGSKTFLAIPYHSGEPSYGSQFGTVAEVLNYTIQMYLEGGLPNSLIVEELERLKQKIKEERKGFPHLKLNELESFQAFRKLVDPKKAYSLMNLSQEDIEEISQNINRHPQLIMGLLATHVFSQLTEFDVQLNAEPQIFGMLFKVIQAMTGTLWNAETYPSSISQIHLSDTTPQTLSLLWEKSPHEIQVVIEPKAKTDIVTLESVLTTIYGTEQANGSFIDNAGIFRLFSNELVAKHILLMPCWTTDAQIKGVAFYDTRGELMVISRQGDGFKIQKLSESAFTKDEIVAYWDQSHTTGSDIKLNSFMTAVMSVSRHLTLYSLEQGVWRLRGLNEGQNIRFIMSEEDHLIIKTVLEQTAGQKIEGPLELRHILLYAFLNQSTRKGNDNYRAFGKKMQAILLEKAIITLLDPDLPIEGVASVYQDLKTLFESETNQRPYHLYGQMKLRGDKETVLKKQAESFINGNLFKAFQTNPYLKGRYSHKKIEEEVRKLVVEEMGKVPDTLEHEENNGKEKEVQTQKSTLKEIEQQKEKQTEKENFLSYRFNPPPVIPWPSGNIFSGSYFEPHSIQSFTGSQPVIKLNEVLTHHSIVMGKYLNNDLLCSSNLCPAQEVPFGFLQKNMNRVLVLENEETGHVQVVLIDKNDVHEFKKKLLDDYKDPSTSKRNLKVGIYHLKLGTLTSGSERVDLEKLETNPKFQLLKVQAKFFNGDVDYSMDEQVHLERWLKEGNPQEMHDLFINKILLYKTTQKKKFEKSPLERIFNKCLKA